MIAAFIDLERSGEGSEGIWSRAVYWMGSIVPKTARLRLCKGRRGVDVDECMVEQGLRQGCPLSLRLLNIFLDRVY